MVEPITASLGSAFFTRVVDHCLEPAYAHILGSEAHHKYRHFLERLHRRLLKGSLPGNENIRHALHQSLAGTSLVFAYALHDPNRKLLRELLREKATWTNFEEFCHQIREYTKGNIVVENPFRGDEWLAKLIELANKPGSFDDFDLNLVLTDNRSTALVGQRIDESLRDHLHNEFLKWADRHVTKAINVSEPAIFASSVRLGLTLPGGDAGTLNFYEIFSLFFRSELKEQTPVHRAYVIEVLAELKGDLDQVIAALPTKDEKDGFQKVIAGLEDFVAFKELLTRQNAVMLETLLKTYDLAVEMDAKLDQLLTRSAISAADIKSIARVLSEGFERTTKGFRLSAESLLQHREALLRDCVTVVRRAIAAEAQGQTEANGVLEDLKKGDPKRLLLYLKFQALDPAIDASNRAQLLRQIIVVAHSCKDYVEAKLAAEQLIEALPNDLEALYYAGCSADELCDNQAAAAYFEQLISKTRGTVHVFPRFMALSALITIYNKRSDFEKAYEAADSATKLAGAFGMPLLEGVVRTDVAQLRLRTGNLEGAEALAKEAINIFAPLKEEAVMAQCYRVLGGIAIERAEFDSASNFIKKAFEIDKRMKSADGIIADAVLFTNIGRHIGEPETAGAMVREVKLFGVNPAALALLSSNSGLDAMSRGEFDLAEHLIRESVVIYEAMESKEDLAIDYVLLAKVDRARGNYTSALKMAAAALKIYESIHHQRGIASAKTELAEVALVEARFSDCEVLVGEILTLSRSTRDLVRSAVALGVIGRLRRLQGRLSEAVDAHHEAFTIAENIHHSEGVAFCLGHIGDVFLDQGKILGAYWCALKAASVNALLSYREELAHNMMLFGDIAKSKKLTKVAHQFWNETLRQCRKMRLEPLVREVRARITVTPDATTEELPFDVFTGQRQLNVDGIRASLEMPENPVGDAMARSSA